MAGFIQNIIWNSVEGFIEAGTRTVGGYAGNALIGVGDMIENSGRSVGSGLERRATGYGSVISGQTYKPSPKALPSTSRKPVVKRSNSLPASAKPSPGTNKGTTIAKKTTAQRTIPPFHGTGPVTSASAASHGAKKTAVKAGQYKPFVPPVEQKKADSNKAYPGTNTAQGQGGKTPVKKLNGTVARTVNRSQRQGAALRKGQNMQHIKV